MAPGLAPERTVAQEAVHGNAAAPQGNTPAALRRAHAQDPRAATAAERADSPSHAPRASREERHCPSPRTPRSNARLILTSTAPSLSISLSASTGEHQPARESVLSQSRRMVDSTEDSTDESRLER